MSKKGDCYDNAAMNRFDFKAMILTFHGERFLSRSDAKYQVFDYIEVYYNLK